VAHFGAPLFCHEALKESGTRGRKPGTRTFETCLDVLPDGRDL
jgi:hypothetical protein